MIYTGSCHCGRTAFEVEGELTGVMDCNCSICSRKGSLLWFVPRDKLRLLTPEESLATYTFNSDVSRRPIAAGEELLDDYRITGDVPLLPCNCGSSRCRGYLNRPSEPAPAQTQ